MCGAGPESLKQLTTRKSEWSENHKLRVENKDKMRAEGRHSPDRGDAQLGCIVCGSRLSGTVTAREMDAAEGGRSAFGGPAVGWW